MEIKTVEGKFIFFPGKLIHTLSPRFKLISLTRQVLTVAKSDTAVE